MSSVCYSRGRKFSDACSLLVVRELVRTSFDRLYFCSLFLMRAPIWLKVAFRPRSPPNRLPASSAGSSLTSGRVVDSFAGSSSLLSMVSVAFSSF